MTVATAGISETSTDIIARTCLLMDELGAIATAASREGLRCMPLKGAAMIIAGYDDESNRPMCDIDLLIRPDEYPRWTGLLEGRTFTPLPYSDSAFVKNTGDPPLIFDLHTGLRFISPDLVKTAWERSLRKTYVAIEYELLNVEIDLPYRCLHMCVTHGYGAEKWLRDLDAIIRAGGPSMSWESMIDVVRKCRATAPFCAMLQLLIERFATPVPGKVFDILDKETPVAAKLLFAHTLKRPGGIPFFDYLAPLLLQPSPGTMCQAACRKLFPPLTFMRSRYNVSSGAIAALYYPVRLVLLVGKGIRAFLHGILFLALKPLHR